MTTRIGIAFGVIAAFVAAGCGSDDAPTMPTAPALSEPSPPPPTAADSAASGGTAAQIELSSSQCVAPEFKSFVVNFNMFPHIGPRRTLFGDFEYHGQQKFPAPKFVFVPRIYLDAYLAEIPWGWPGSNRADHKRLKDFIDPCVRYLKGLPENRLRDGYRGWIDWQIGADGEWSDWQLHVGPFVSRYSHILSVRGAPIIWSHEVDGRSYISAPAPKIGYGIQIRTRVRISYYRTIEDSSMGRLPTYTYTSPSSKPFDMWVGPPAKPTGLKATVIPGENPLIQLTWDKPHPSESVNSMMVYACKVQPNKPCDYNWTIPDRIINPNERASSVYVPNRTSGIASFKWTTSRLLRAIGRGKLEPQFHGPGYEYLPGVDRLRPDTHYERFERGHEYAFTVVHFARVGPRDLGRNHNYGFKEESPLSDWLTVRIPSPDTPEQPTIVRTETGHRSVTITWDPPLESTVTGYEERHRRADATSWRPWTVIPGSDGDTIGHTWNGLTNGTMYQFQVRGVNEEGAGIASTIVSRRPQSRPPEAPTITDVTGGADWIRVEWDPPAGYTITRWQSRMKLDTASTWADWQPIPASDSTEHTFRGLTSGVRYDIQIRGVNEAGPGTWSTPVRWRAR